MANSRLFGAAQGMASLHRTLIDIQNVERAREEADALKNYMPMAEASGVLGDARLADMEDIKAANLLDTKGLFFGSYRGRMLFYSGIESVMTILKAGGGKGRDLVLPNLAHFRGRSAVVGDYKNGENAYATWDHRFKTLGIPCIALDPFNISGRGNTCINPMQGLLDLAGDGLVIDDEADELAHILVPISPKDTNTWPQEGARELIATFLEYAAYCDPAECCPGGAWRFWNQSTAKLERTFKMMTTCGFDSVERSAHTYLSILTDAPKQFAAYRSAANKHLRPFASGKPLDKATSKNDFDLAKLKQSPHTIYIITPSRKLSVAAIWISLIVNHMIEVIANAQGPIQTTLMLDEFAQMPPSPAIPKTIRLYRECGVQPWLIVQSLEALKDKWSEDAVREFVSQSGLLTMKMISDPVLMKDISYWSGTRSVILHGHNHGGGKLVTASEGISESKRAVLQAEDILALGKTRQIVKIADMERLLVCETVPWYTVHPWADQLKDVRAYHRGKT